MPLFLQKMLTTLVMPAGVVCLLLALALVLRLTGQRRSEGSCVGLALAILWLAGSPAVAIALLGQLEAQFPPQTMAALPQSDVIIVLGGTVEPASQPRVVAQLHEGSNRLAYAARLFAAGKAPRILVSGGRLGWRTDIPPEAETMIEVLTWFGVPRSAIEIEGASQTTIENAQFTTEIVRTRGWQSALLVTSALHMPRALRAFACMNLKITPAPADIRVSDVARGYEMQWFPNSAMLGWTSLAIKEYIGLVVGKKTACATLSS